MPGRTAAAGTETSRAPGPSMDFDDRFRQGLFAIATATTRTELKWLRETLAALDGSSGARADQA